MRSLVAVATQYGHGEEVFRRFCWGGFMSVESNDYLKEKLELAFWSGFGFKEWRVPLLMGG